MPRRVGFTGTQDGMTHQQIVSVADILHSLYIDGAEFHFGGCVGSDDEGAVLAKANGYWTVCHRGSSPGKHGRFVADEELPATDNLERNRRIVRKAGGSAVIATPKETSEVTRSGTWMTIRHALKSGVQTWIVWPNGTATILDSLPLERPIHQ